MFLILSYYRILVLKGIKKNQYQKKTTNKPPHTSQRKIHFLYSSSENSFWVQDWPVCVDWDKLCENIENRKIYIFHHENNIFVFKGWGKKK